MFFTIHAVERFRKRWAGGLSYQHALRELKLLGQRARPLRDHTHGGQERWEASDGSGLVFVCKRDRGRHGTGLVCVTVLPHGEQVDAELESAELA